MALKGEMDVTWLAWFDPENSVALACLGVTRHGTAQVEFVLSAAK